MTTPVIDTRKVLMLTNIEHGQSNVFLAAAQAILEADPSVEVHFATFRGLEGSVAEVSEYARGSTPGVRPIVYHEIQGLSYRQGLQNYTERHNIPARPGYFADSVSTPLSFSATKQAIRDFLPAFIPYTGEELGEIVASIIGIIKDVNADLVVLDPLMTAGLTTVWHLQVKYMVLSPNTIKDFAAAGQPRGEKFWKYPALFTGYSYPVPWHLIPLNVYFLFYMAYLWITSRHRKETTTHLKDKLGIDLKTAIDLQRSTPESPKIAVGFLPELDFEGILPNNILPCGPILRSALPIEESDPELGKWLAKGPTVYINLGSMCQIDEQQMIEMASAIKATIDRFQTSCKRPLQVLWKLKTHKGINTQNAKIVDILGKDIVADQVRIVDWVVSEPIAILRTGHVICSVHHGGANSFNEAVRVEMLGVGRLGSKNTKPRWTAKGLGQSLIDVIMGKDYEAMKKRAEDLARLCKDAGEGREVAAKFILEEMAAEDDLPVSV
ncbi:uncharacterized protein NECHADRAFT_52204 [Fusarium vanettenii 77-13-4]|uniref:Glycosyltransferase family 28 N-terminal domain-containing protein n=1 Tax=Fusarium vanettenii (strain ATCC MYA-4622 / CBS 123669 / FGSC 9596 / NRRL 45880 / 77-13-4) TaxID=660122 RepID=C7ZFW6_FUSV7|nr:uncharacterized protein NECHADRAFT_52204 [Fusarium vanettenii 77-13-4]EEU37048.1 hypothetical protein NECHADRAFT_52204 [Fusarium vanettenii 77-13-4]